jgi:thioredoxin-like negative regulator of GroEL
MTLDALMRASPEPDAPCERDGAGAARRDEQQARLVFFLSQRSGRCRRCEGFLAQVLQRRKNHDTVRIYRVDIEARPDLAERFAVTTVPTICVIDRRRVRARIESPTGVTELTAALSPWLR